MVVSDGPLPSPPRAPITTRAPLAPLNASAPFANSTIKSSPGYRNALYFTNWLVSALTYTGELADHLRGIYGANYQPQQLPGDQITHVLYAFADIAADGEV